MYTKLVLEDIVKRSCQCLFIFTVFRLKHRFNCSNESDYLHKVDSLMIPCVLSILFYKFCPNLLNGGIDVDRAHAKQSLLR